MTSLRRISCAERDCIHYYRAMGPSSKPIHVCRAFPLGIPEAITVGKVTHDQPYAGDGGIVFQAVTDADEVLRYGSTEPEMTRGNTPDQAVQMDASAWSDSFDPVAEQEAMEDGSDDEQDIEPAEAAPEMEAGGVEPESGDDDEEATKIGPSWDESKIRRIPKGMPGAGRFAPKYVGYVRGRKIDPSELAVWRKFRRENPDPEQWPKRREYNKYGRDEIALEMLHRQGFDNLPLVLPPNEFDRWVAENNALVLYRGVEDGKYFTGEFDANGNPVVGKQTAREITDQFRYGQFYWGNGTFGNGTYASADRGVAEAYGNLDPDSQIGDIPGDLLVMAVRPEAIIVDHQKLKYEFAHSTFVPPSMPKELYDSALVLFNKGRPDDARGVISTWVREHPYREHEYMFGDLGRYALLQGHDAQRITTELGYTEYVIFNRTALVVRGAE